MRNRLFILLLIIFTAPRLWAQPGSVSGTIQDDKETIPGAKIVLENTDYKVLSDFEGKFRLKDIPAGKYLLIVTSTSMEDVQLEIEVVSGQETKVGRLMMKPPKSIQDVDEVNVRHKQDDGEGKANTLQKTENTIGNVEYVGDGEQVAYNAADNLQKMPAVTVRKDQGEGRYMSVRGTPTNWNSTLINGDRLPVADEESETRTMAFDVISSDLLAYIKVAKALTPDLEGDAIGGAVNFITKSSPDSLELRVNVMSGYNAQSQQPIYNGNIFFGSRSKDKKFGFLINASSYVRNWGTDNFEVVYGSNFNHGLNRLELRDYTGVRSTYSGNVALDYEFSKGNKLFFKSMIGYFTDNEWNMKTRYNYAIGAGSTIMLQHIHSVAQSLLYGGELGGEFKLSEKLGIDFKLSHYSNQFGYGPVPFKGKDDRNGYMVLNFEKFNVKFQDQIYIDKYGGWYNIDEAGNPIDENGQVVTDPTLELARVKLIGEDDPRGNGDPWDNIQPMVGGDNKLEDYEFSGAYTELNTTWEKDPMVGSLNLSYEAGKNLKLKFGGKFRSKEGYRSLSLHDWHQDFNVFSDALNLVRYPNAQLNLNGGFLQELGQPYEGQFLPFMDQSFIDGFIDYLGDTLRQEPMTVAHHEYYEFVGSTYSYKELAEAGYAMAEYQLNKKWSIIGGIRVEATQLTMEADTIYDGEDDWFLANIYDVPGEGYQVVDIDDDPYAGIYDPIIQYTVGYPVEKVQLKLNYVAPLPMLHVRFDPNNQTVIRAAITRTYQRPNFIETKPGSPVINYTNLEFNQGNPSLRPSFVWNADLSYEYYMPNAGLFTVGLYGKRVEDHIYRTITADIDPQLGIIYKSYQNADKPIYVGGIEINAKKKFDFFKNFFKDFGVDMNVTYTYSRMQIPGRSFSQSLPMQPSLLFNSALFYEHEKTDIKGRLSVNYTDKYLMEVNTSAILDESQQIKLLHDDTEYDIFMRHKWSLDFSLGWKINRQFQLYSELTNLLNAPFYIYRGQEYRPMQVEYYSIRATLGMKFNL